MTQILTILVNTIVWLGVITASAVAPPDEDESCACRTRNTDHLVPILFESELAYRTVLVQKLFVSTSEYGRAVVIPSSNEGERSIALYSVKQGETELETHVTYTKADRNIWYAQSRNDKTPINIHQVEAPISRTTALAVSRAWKQMLCRTQPRAATNTEKVLVDATAIEFSLVDDNGEALYGKAADQPGENTKALYQIATQLMGYCEASPSKRESIAKKIEHDANALVERIKAQK